MPGQELVVISQQGLIETKLRCLGFGIIAQELELEAYVLGEKQAMHKA
jgi:hypothetical protein